MTQESKIGQQQDNFYYKARPKSTRDKEHKN